MKKEREFAPLLATKDNWDKYITMDEWASGNIEWVKWINIIEFLEKYL